MADRRAQTETLGSFLAWRQSRHGAAATEDVIEAADQLLSMSAGRAVGPSHVEQLIDGYRRRSAPPRAILAVQAVADDLRLFQQSQTDSHPGLSPEPGGARNQRGYAIQDEDSLPFPPSDTPIVSPRSNAPPPGQRPRRAADDNRDQLDSGIELDLDDDVRGSAFKARFHVPGISSKPPSRVSSTPPFDLHRSDPPPDGFHERGNVPPSPVLPNIGSQLPTRDPMSAAMPGPAHSPAAGPKGTADGRSYAPGVATRGSSYRPPSGGWLDSLLEDAPPHSGKVAAALLVVIIAGVIYKSGCLVDDDPVEVRGSLSSEHLGVKISFTDPWMHAPDYDRSEEKDGWESRWSVFYRGESPRKYDAQLTVKVLVKDDETPATEKDARSAGASETLDQVSKRECFQEDYTMCRALYARLDLKRFSLFEYFFAIGGKVVVVRAIMPIPEPGTERVIEVDPQRKQPLDLTHDPEHEDEATAIAESIVPLTEK